MTQPLDPIQAKRDAEARRIARRERLSGWGDYVSFFSAKLAGVGATAVGALEWFQPALLDIVVNNPELVMGGGLSLLTGPKVVAAAAKVAKSLGK